LTSNRKKKPSVLHIAIILPVCSYLKTNMLLLQ